MRCSFFVTLFFAFALAPFAHAQERIDRRALVERHAVELTQIDPHAPVMLGNGDLGFTADITGLQTFPEQYSSLVPLMTMAQWAWHSFPNLNGFTEADGEVMIPVPGRGEQPYAAIRDWSELQSRPALVWLRENPHRFALGRIALTLTRADGSAATFADLSQTRQRLDMWTGTLTSSFVFDGETVTVVTRMHPERDMVMVDVRSPLVASGRVGVEVRFPGVSRQLNPNPQDWSADAVHHTRVVRNGRRGLLLNRQIDATEYFSEIVAPGAAITHPTEHRVAITSRSQRLRVMVSFEQAEPARAVSYDSGVRAVTRHWRAYWMHGGVVDFSGSTDPRAVELERRVVLSQYLAAINQAGDYPPQEEGLFSNSWNGKFHLEVHPLHAAHFATWGRPELLERSLAWYLSDLPRAQREARRHGVEGAWWPKMTGPSGLSSPSTINPFIMWQQPNPIFMAELVYRTRRDEATLARYGEMVEETAKLLATWPIYDAANQRYVLGPPVVPVQENHPALTTVNPAFELEFYRWGLQTAQQWRERRGLARDPQWDRVIAQLAPPPEHAGLYLPVETAPNFWRDTISEACRQNAVEAPCLNRDHPSFLMLYGYINGPRASPRTMRQSLDAVAVNWDLRQTWGWDFPVIAMTAARVGQPEEAVDWLFSDTKNNQWGVTGMTPRVHLDAHAEQLLANAPPPGPDGPGYRRAAETYFPSNGSLLLAVGMMAAGWDGSEGQAPGFPQEGWRVRSEGITPLP